MEVSISPKQRRLELRQLNLAAWSNPQTGLGKLDTSLKRHTSLLARLRTTLHSQLSIAGLLKDILGLSLEKYIEEVISAVLEGLLKCKSGPEVAGAVEVISALHQRFPSSFSVPFAAAFLPSLKPGTSVATDREIKEKEDAARIIRQRGLLRVLGELEAVGAIRKDEGKSLTGDLSWSILRELLTSDKNGLGLAAPLGIAFAKHLGHLYLPHVVADPTESDGFPTLAQSNEVEGEDVIVGREVKDKFRKLLVAYLDALGRQEGKNHIELQRTDKKNHEAYIRSGEVFEDREKNYEKSVRAWERGWASVTQLSEILLLPVPNLPSLTSTSTAQIVTAGTATFTAGEEIGGPGSLWLDEEDRDFYEELRELRGEVPSSILGIPIEKEVEVEPEEPVAEEAVTEIETDPLVDEAELENPITAATAEIDPSEPTLLAGPAAQLSAIFARLPEASSKVKIDLIAIEFAFLNSKAARKRLVKFLASVHRNRQDVIPYYARFVATLDSYMPEIAKELVTILEEEFRYLQRKKNVDLGETRSKNLRYFSELIKFKLVPNHAIFHIYKVLLDDFSGTNIENLCNFLEGCGRFLLRSNTGGTSEKMGIILETVKRKKKAATHLDSRMVTMLENAYYQCDPPDRPIAVAKIRTPMQGYIRQLFYHTLTRNSVDKVLKLVRKLHWEDPAIVSKLHSAFTKVWKIKYSNIHLFAILLYDLGRYHPDFSISVIDEVLENVRVGMEINNFKYNQQRVATIKYLGELYIYRVIESRIIFDTLWSLVTFGHPDGRPHPANASQIDSFDDHFRIRLVCVLLDACGSCFEKGALKKKLDNFLIFFQMYVLSKRNLPMDVDFMMSDTFEQIRPKTIMFKTFNEAALAVDEMMAVLANSVTVEDEPDEIEVDGGEDGRRGEGEPQEADEDSDSTINDNSDVEEIEEEIEESRRVDPNAITEEEEEEFNRELAKMLVSTAASTPVSSNSNQTSKVEKDKNGFIITRKKALVREPQRDPDPDLTRALAESMAMENGFRGEVQPREVEETKEKGMVFTLLTKKGNKQQSTPFEIPLSTSIALSTISKQAKDKKEQQEMKKLVLDYESREEINETKSLVQTMAARGINLKFTKQTPP